MPEGVRGQEAVRVSAAFTALAGCCVLLRLYTRFCIVKCAGIEDYIISVALICSVGLTACIGVQVQYGMGLSGKYLSESDLRNSLKAFWASLIVYYLSLGLTKISILLQYRRVFPTRGFQILCWCIFSVVICYTVWTVFGSIFACVPVRAFWTHEKPSKCINQFAMWFTNAGINIVTDFAIIILPMPLIRKLNIARRQKQALIGVFAVGGFVCVVSILRLQSLIAISNSTDPTKDNPPAATWSAVETNVGIICSCLPCLRPLVSRCFPRFFSSRHNNGGTTGRTPYSRNAYGRQASSQGNGPDDIELDWPHGQHGVPKFDDIKVVTEVRVSVEDKDDDKTDIFSTTGKRKVSSEGSTDTLVRDLERTISRKM